MTRKVNKVDYSPLINERERRTLEEQDEQRVLFREGQTVVDTTNGLLDVLVTVQQARHWLKDHTFFRHCILLKSMGGSHSYWMLRSAVRLTMLRDLQPINGLRFSEWQAKVYWSLIYSTHTQYEANDRPQLSEWWEQGHSPEYATMQLIAFKRLTDYGLDSITLAHHRALLITEPSQEAWASLHRSGNIDVIPLKNTTKGQAHARR